SRVSPAQDRAEYKKSDFNLDYLEFSGVRKAY
ncbi:unnamed protein product, partial [marine sediment metagenome]